MGLVLGMALKFYINLAMILNIKFRNLRRLISTIVEEKIVGGAFLEY